MLVAMVFQWLRAATQDPARRSACLTYATTILVAQAGWVLLLLAEMSVLANFLWAVPLILLELSGSWIAETRKGGTPGTLTTSPSATGCWRSLRLARASSAPSPRWPPWSSTRAGAWTPPWSAWPGLG
jgi:hypothetical protein